MCPTYIESHVNACTQYYFNKGDDDPSQLINISIIHSHLNYTGAIRKNTITQRIQVNNKLTNAHMLWHSRVLTHIL